MIKNAAKLFITKRVQSVMSKRFWRHLSFFLRFEFALIIMNAALGKFNGPITFQHYDGIRWSLNGLAVIGVVIFSWFLYLGLGKNLDYWFDGIDEEERRPRRWRRYRRNW